MLERVILGHKNFDVVFINKDYKVCAPAPALTAVSPGARRGTPGLEGTFWRENPRPHARDEGTQALALRARHLLSIRPPPPRFRTPSTHPTPPHPTPPHPTPPHPTPPHPTPPHPSGPGGIGLKLLDPPFANFTLWLGLRVPKAPKNHRKIT